MALRRRVDLARLLHSTPTPLARRAPPRIATRTVDLTAVCRSSAVNRTARLRPRWPQIALATRAAPMPFDKHVIGRPPLRVPERPLRAAPSQFRDDLRGRAVPRRLMQRREPCRATRLPPVDVDLRPRVVEHCEYGRPDTFQPAVVMTAAPSAVRRSRSRAGLRGHCGGGASRVSGALWSCPRRASCA